MLLFGATMGVAQEAVPSTNAAGEIQAQIADGRRLLQQKKFQEALQRFESVLARDDSNAEAFFYAGTIYIILRQTQKGLNYIERSVALAPDNIRLHFILAQTYENLSMPDKALDMYRKVEKMAPRSQEAMQSARAVHLLLGKKYGEQGKFEQALQEFSSILADFPNDIPALMNKALTLSYMGQFDKARAAFEKALTIQPNNPLLHRYLAEVLEKQGDIAQAKKHYERVLRLVPHDSPLFKLAEMKLALINGADLLAKGELEEAKREFEKVLAVDSRNPIALLNLAKVYHGLGDMKRSGEILSSLVEDNPNDLDARLRLGTLYLELGRLKEAVHEFEDVIARGKSTLQAQQAAELLDSVRSAEKGKLAQDLSVDERITLYKSTLKQNPDDRQAWLDLGYLYFQLKRQDEAMEALENVIRLDPNDPRTLAVLGGLYQDKDMFAKAVETYRQALELEKNPTQKQNLERQLAMARARKAFSDGERQDAEKQFKVIVNQDPNNYIAHFYLALIYSQDGGMDQAISEYKQVLRIVPRHLGARLNLAIAYEQTGHEEAAVTEYQTVARAGVAGLSDTAKERLDALIKRVGGFSYTFNYALNFDSNSNLSPVNPIQELLSNVSGSVVYRRKISHKRIYWGLRTSPTYSVYHRQQFDFLRMDFSPFVNLTWRGLDFSGNYSYSQTNSVLENKSYNKTNTVYADVLNRFKMKSLLPFLTAKDQRNEAPSAWRINGNYQDFRSDTSPVYDSSTYSIGLLLNQGSSSGWSWTGTYTYTNHQNLKAIGNDFAYSSHGVNFQLSKSITPKLHASGSYGFTYSSYTHPDSVTKFTKYRVNKLHSLSAGLDYSVNKTMKLYCNLVYQRNDSNLPTGFILSSEDASTLVGIQSPSLGDYRRYGVSAGFALNF